MISWISRSAIFALVLLTLASFIAGPAGAVGLQGKKALAEAYDLPVPKKLTTFKHPVVYASPDVYTKRVDGKTIVRQTLIIKWGLHVFEVVEGIYQCAGKATTGFKCEWVDHTRVATYSSCNVDALSDGEKPKCTGLVSGNSGPTEDIDAGWDPESERNVINEWTEFPERENDPENPIR
jgi:hypothetical protein